MRRVFLREMSAFLSTPVPYFITGIFLLVSGLFFFHETAAVSLLSSQIAQTQVSAGVSLSELLLVPFFWDASMLVIFLGPLVPLGLYAGKGTTGPAYVFPVSDEKIAFGRYLAALAVLGAMLFLGAFHVVVLAFFTAPDWGIVFSSFLGLLLLGAAVLAMGAFASALTRHQASSAALAMGIALVFWTAGWFAPLVPGSTAGAVLQELSIPFHLSRFFRGMISLRDLSYFLALTVFFLGLTTVFRGGAGTGVQATPPGPYRAVRGAGLIVLLACTLLFAHLILISHDRSGDVSSNGRNRLDLRTENIIRRLKSDVGILVFQPAGKNARGAGGLLDLFARGSRRISFSIVDPDLQPSLARRYGITRYGQAVILARGRSVVLERSGEEEIANALLSLEQGRKKNIYVLSGHGEGDIFSTGRAGLSGLRESLERSGYGVHKSILSGQDAVPWDADLLVIPGPRVELGPEELYAVSRFIEKGGSLLVALEPRMDGGLKALLSESGVELNGAVVKDPSSRALGGDESVLVVDTYGKMKGLDGFSHTTLFPTARPLGTGRKLPPRTVVSPVARASGASRSSEAGDPGADRAGVSGGYENREGPPSIALLARKTSRTGAHAGVLVFGDADFLTNAYLNVSGNRDLAAACVGMLLHGGSHVPIDARRGDERPFVLTPAQGFAAFLFSVVLLPLPFFLAGAWFKRAEGGE